MQKTIKRILLLIILFCTFIFINYAYAETDEDVTSKFTDENLKNAIIEIIRKVENNSEKSNILMSDINTITADSLTSGKQLNLAGKNISSLNGLELFANKNIELSTTSQLDDESVIQILEVCLKQLKEKASQEAVPIGKEK